MTSDEARAEAESFSWAEYRREVAPNTRHAGREAVAFKAGFDAGAGWQAERDAERIAEMEAEAERLRAAHDLVRETVLTQADAAGAVKAFAKMLAAGDDIKRLEATLTAATTAMVEAENRAEQADAERDALAAVIERVRALHKFIPAGIGGISLAACSCGVTAPCPTWSALNDKAEQARDGGGQ